MRTAIPIHVPKINETEALRHEVSNSDAEGGPSTRKAKHRHKGAQTTRVFGPGFGLSMLVQRLPVLKEESYVAASWTKDCEQRLLQQARM